MWREEPFTVFLLVARDVVTGVSGHGFINLRTYLALESHKLAAGQEWE